MKIGAGEFKAKCLRLMDLVRETREEVVITKHGKPVARLVPADGKRPARKLLGCLRGTVEIRGDIVAPVGEAWDAEP